MLDSDDLKTYLLTRKDGTYSIEIKAYGDRTLSQNAYYWQILTIASKETGHSPQELHYFFKFKFLGEQGDFPSTKELDIETFGAYLEEVQNELGRMGIVIPEHQ